MKDKISLFTRKRSMVLKEIETVLMLVDHVEIERLVIDIMEAQKVFLVGVGRVMLSCQAWAKRLNHIGISACCVGDITEPALTPNDILIVVSGSGESIVPVAIAEKAKRLGAKKIIHIGSNPHGSVRTYVDYMIRIPTKTKLNLSDEFQSKQIMTSLFEQCVLILGDVLAQVIVEERDIDIELLWENHANLE